MKKVLITLIAFLALTISVTAQDKMGKKGHGKHHQKGMMAKELNFTDAQKAQAKTINEDSRKKMQELNKNVSITVKEMRDRKAAIHKERKSKMDGLLTADQKAKQTQLRAEVKNQHNKIFTPEQLKKKEEMKKNRGDRSRVKK